MKVLSIEQMHQLKELGVDVKPKGMCLMYTSDSSDNYYLKYGESTCEGKDKLSYDDLKDTPNLEYLIRTFSARDYDFIELKDTPSSYAGSAGKIVRVNSSGTGLEFVTISSSYTLVENEHPPESADDSRVNFTFLHTPIANSEKVFVGLEE